MFFIYLILFSKTKYIFTLCLYIFSFLNFSFMFVKNQIENSESNLDNIKKHVIIGIIWSKLQYLKNNIYIFFRQLMLI